MGRKAREIEEGAKGFGLLAHGSGVGKFWFNAVRYRSGRLADDRRQSMIDTIIELILGH
jgi:hypothetical protein